MFSNYPWLFVFLTGLGLTGSSLAQTPTPKTPTSVDAKMPAGDGLISTGVRTLHEYWWTSQFKASLGASPDNLRDAVYLRYYGSLGKAEADQRKLNDNIIRYGKHVPGLGTGMSLFEEFAKDARKWDGGIEAKKSAVAEILNRCPECLDEFAHQSYDLLRTKKRGGVLSTEELPYAAYLDSLVGTGKLLDGDASIRSLVQRSNPNDVQTWRSSMELRLLKALSKANASQFDKLMHDDESLRSLLTANGTDISQLVAKFSTETAELKSQIHRLYEVQEDEQKKKLAQQQFEGAFSDANATVYLVGTLLSLQSPTQAKQFVGVATASLSAAKAIEAYILNPKTISEVAMAATVVGAVVAIVDIMASSPRNPENEYVIRLLCDIKIELDEIKVAVNRLDYRVDVALSGIARLQADSAAQFSALRTALYELSAQLSDKELADWQKSRESYLRKVADTLSLCRIKFPTKWSWKKTANQRQEEFKTTCLLPILLVAERDAVTANVQMIPFADMKRDDQIDKFRAAIGLVPNETWIPLLAGALPRKGDQVTSGGVSVYLTGGEPYPDDAVKLDVQIWHAAVVAYTELLSFVPDLSLKSDAELERLDSSIRARGLSLEAFLNRRSTTSRLEASVESYRQSSEDLLSAIHSLSTRFIQRKLGVWCSNDSLSLAMQNQGEWRSRWLEAECKVATQRPGTSRTVNPFNAVEAPAYRTGGDIFNPELLVFYPDVVFIASLYRNTDSKRFESLRPLQPGVSGWNSPDDVALLRGLRALAQARMVLELTDRSKSNVFDLSVKLPPVKGNSLSDLEACALKHDDMEPRARWEYCFKNTLVGCIEIAEGSPFDSFKYMSCGNFTHGTPKMREENNFPIISSVPGILKKTLDEQVPVHLASAASMRDNGPLRLYGPGNYCSARPKGSDPTNCGLGSPPTTPWRSDFVSNIKGIDPAGTFDGNGTYRVSHQLGDGDTIVTEGFDVGAMADLLNDLGPQLADLRHEWYDYINSQNSSAVLNPLYARQNQAYAMLLAQTFITLQSAAVKSSALDSFVTAPISGAEIAKSFVAGRPAEQLSLRLLLRDKLWWIPFPTMDRFHDAILNADELSCTPFSEVFGFQGETVQILTRRQTGSLPTTYGTDLYCNMWQSQLDRPRDALGIRFPTNSRLLSEGLGYLAGQRNDEYVTRLHSD